MKTVLACLAFLLFAGNAPAFAGDYFHSCADASGDLVITDGVLRAPQSGTDSGEGREIKFRETRRITIRREEGQCVSKSCGQSFGYELESYLLFAEFNYDGIPYQATFICELAVSTQPAACDCDESTVTYQRDLKPEFTEEGKAQKAE